MSDLRLKTIENLSPVERSAFDSYIQSGKPPLSARTAAEMFELYCNGCDCQEISRLNPSFGLGIIVRARVDFDWDLRKKETVDSLFGGVREKVAKIHLEAISFAADAMSVHHKVWGDKLKKYLQTGNEELLDGWNVSNKGYKDAIEILAKLTDLNKQQAPIPMAQELPKPATVVNVPQKGALTESQAFEILKQIEEKGNK